MSATYVDLADVASFGSTTLPTILWQYLVVWLVCRLVGWLVGWSVVWLVCWLVGWLVRLIQLDNLPTLTDFSWILACHVASRS